MRDHEVVLPRRVVPQPQPEIVAGGDCGACVLAGLFGLEVRHIYARLCEGKEMPIGHRQMYGALWEAKSIGLADRIVTSPARWPKSSEGYVDAFGHLASKDCLNWWAYLRLAFDAGYYALAEVDSTRQGPTSSTDHWVMLVGVRERCPAGPGPINNEVLVSCSSSKTPEEEWVDASDFLLKRGGYNSLLARPAT